MAEQKQDNNEALYIIGFVLLIYIVLLYAFGESIAGFHLTVRGWWADLAAWALPFKKFDAIAIALDTYSPREWMAKNGALAQLSKDLRLIMFLPMATILGWYAWRVWRAHPSRGLRTVHDRTSLLKSQVSEWPWVAPVLGLDLASEPIDSGRWAMAQTPVDFARKYRLLEGRELNRRKTDKFFTSQLGKLWEGPDRLPRHVRALMACFAAQACGDKDGARAGLRTLALSMAAGKPDYGFADGLLAKHLQDPRLLPAFQGHAYVVTVLMRLLELREGVLPPAYFLWLRPRNRALWYALNNTGRRAAFCEAAGVHSHYLCEKLAGHGIEHPCVKHATQALKNALLEYKFD